MLKLLASKIHTRSVQGIDRLQINSNTGSPSVLWQLIIKHFSHGRFGQGRVSSSSGGYQKGKVQDTVSTIHMKIYRGPSLPSP